MKKAFTLVELLIVVVILVTLMSMVFRLGAVGGASQERAVTISRMQRLENCISGYYAAFGSYPPVKLHGTRDVYYEVSDYGIQQTENGNRDPSRLDWNRVEAACRAQPLGMSFPFPSSMDDRLKQISEELTDLHNNDDEAFSAYKNNPKLANLTGNVDAGWLDDSSDWNQTQLFRFGLMSYLLPRFVVMMGNDDNGLYKYRQWTENNQLPCRFEDGSHYKKWEDLNANVVENDNGDTNDSRWKVEALPSQAVTARWIPNLQGILCCESDITVFGITVSGADSEFKNFTASNPYPMIYSPNAQNGGDSSRQYVLDSVTCRDGWKREYYYYSEPPYQSYRLWSAGPNGKTFAPWISEEEFDYDQTLKSNRATIQDWISDDIVHMSN